MTTVLIAHGSPDPRHAAALEGLRARIEEPLRRAGHGQTRLVYLEHDHPTPAEIAPQLEGDVTVVPMLITPAMHARVDIPTAMRRLGAQGARPRIVPALGGHALLLDAVDELLRSAGHDPGRGVLVVAGGSRSGQAGQSISRLLAEHPRPGWMTMTLAAPRAGAAHGRVVVPATLAEGVLHDKVQVLAETAGSPFVGGGLAATAALADLVCHRVLA